LGGIADNDEAGIVWNGGIIDQGIPWERFVAMHKPGVTVLRANSKAFDHFDDDRGDAISAKTLNTLSVTYIKKPQKIYGKLKVYVDAAADYTPRSSSDLNLNLIEKKTIQLAVPEYTAPAQWQRILRAITYGKRRGVAIIVTRIR
jgi:filamentous hemagglutinin